MPKNPRKTAPGRWMILLLAGCLAFNFGCPQLQALIDSLVPSTGDPNTVDPNTVDPNTVDPNAVDPNEVDPNAPIVTGDTAIGGEFVGSTRCGLCHINTYNHWGRHDPRYCAGVA